MAFISLLSFDATAEVTADIRARAAQFGRKVKCCTYPFVVWRETEKEARNEDRRRVEIHALLLSPWDQAPAIRCPFRSVFHIPIPSY
jgi:alkanesulfonate monooxygenase SsuD/methylene tetrahydromethanopterin reductase-like flavin-dependent oxidoreductase (luciferase family)